MEKKQENSKRTQKGEKANMTQEERKRMLKIWIELFLKHELDCAKRGMCHLVNSYHNQLIGMLQYAQSTKEIDEETFQKLMKLSHTIQKKYHI